MWITVVSIVVAFVMIIGGGSVTALASQGSLPGQSLWQVKTLSEDFLLLVENKPQESIQIQLKLIERRIEEARLMIGAGNEPAGELVRRLEGHMDRVMQGANFLGSEDLIKNLERVRETYQNQLRLYENFLGTGEMGNNSTAQQIRMLLQERIRLMEKCIEDPIQLQNWTRLQDRIRLQSKDSEWEDSQQNEYQEEFQSEYQYQYEYREHIQNGIDQQPVVPSGVQNEIQQQYEYQFQNQESNSELAPGNNADTSPDKADTDTGKNPQNKLDNGSGQDPENGNTDGESSPGSGQDSKSSDSGSGSQQSGQTGKKP